MGNEATLVEGTLEEQAPPARERIVTPGLAGYRVMTLSVDRERLTRAETETDESKRDVRIPIAISSEYPVERYDWWEGERYLEVLEHSAEAVDLSRAVDGMPFLTDHMSREHVGIVEDVTVDKDRVLRGMLRLSRNPKGQEVRTDILDGIRKSISVGYDFDSNNLVRAQGPDDRMPTVTIKRWTPMEASLVAIPADPTVGIGRSVRPFEARGRAPKGGAAEVPGAGKGAGAGRDNENRPQDGSGNPTPKEEQMGDRGQTTPEGAVTLEQERTRASSIVELAALHGMSDRAGKWIAEGKTRAEVAELILSEKAAATKPTQAAPPKDERAGARVEVRSSVKPEGALEPGIAAARIVRALAANRGDPRRAAEWAERHYGDTAYVRALAATDAASGGFIVPEVYVAEIIELLRPASVVRGRNPVIFPLVNGVARIPKLVGGAAAQYIGENRNVPKTEPVFGQVVATAKKLAALVPISNDLIRRNSPSADTVVRDDLIAALGQRQDLAFIRDDGSQFSPKGLRHYAPAANVIPANGTVNLANVTTDLGKLILALKGANVRMLRPGWLLSPRSELYLMTVRDGNGNFAFREEMLTGRLWGYGYGVTTQIPENLGGGGDESEIYFADFADVVIAEALDMVIDSSTEAAYHDGSQLQAAFSLDQTVVRAITEHDFVMRHDASVAVLTGVTWTP